MGELQAADQSNNSGYRQSRIFNPSGSRDGFSTPTPRPGPWLASPSSLVLLLLSKFANPRGTYPNPRTRCVPAFCPPTIRRCFQDTQAKTIRGPGGIREASHSVASPKITRILTRTYKMSQCVLQMRFHLGSCASKLSGATHADIFPRCLATPRSGLVNKYRKY